MCGQRTQSRPHIGLVFFPPKPTAQPGYVHVNLVHRQTRRPGDGPLHRRWPLRGGIQFKAIVFLRNGVGSLRFDVQMFLPVGVGLALEYMDTLVPGLACIAQPEGSGSHN